MQQASYHYANTIVDQIKNDITNHLQVRDSKVLAMLQSIPSLTEASSGSKDKSSYSHQANSIADQTQLEILYLLKELTQEIKSVKVADPYQPKFSKKTPDYQTKLVCKKADKYCWTHSMGNYDGKACMRRAQGHKE